MREERAWRQLASLGIDAVAVEGVPTGRVVSLGNLLCPVAQVVYLAREDGPDHVRVVAPLDVRLREGTLGVAARLGDAIQRLDPAVPVGVDEVLGRPCFRGVFRVGTLDDLRHVAWALDEIQGATDVVHGWFTAVVGGEPLVDVVGRMVQSAQADQG